MQAEVLAVVHARKTAGGTAAGGGSRGMAAGALVSAAAAGGGGHAATATAATAATAAAAAGVGVDDLELLEQYGCLPEAHGVYTALMTCLQQQQQGQQQQQQSAAGSEVRLQTAAAAAAALAPGLLGAVLRQQGGLPAYKLVRDESSSASCFTRGRVVMFWLTCTKTHCAHSWLLSAW